MWDKLSMQEKAEVMKLAVQNGIYDLDTIIGGYNEYAKGGKIHIKPENRGKLTALKQRTGKTEAELYNDGNPAHKKMVVFARNSRKWKHELGGNLYEGTNPNGQQMQLGPRYWQTQAAQPTFETQLAKFNKQREEQAIQKREQLRQWAENQGKDIVEKRTRDYLTASIDNTKTTPANAPKKKENTHLEERAIKGAESNAIWEKEHPNLTAWGNTLAMIPFAVAASPVLGAAAETAAGQAVTSGLSFAANAAKATPYVSTALPWAEAAFNTAVSTHGIQELKEGNFTPITTLELSPLAPPTIGIANNLYLPHLREHIYASKAPIGYSGFGPAIRKTVEGILSGKRANINSPDWFNAKSAEQLQEYAYVPDYVQGAEKEQYLKEFGERALKARTDMWRMYNRLPQKYGTFVPSEKYPGAYTASEDIKALKWVPTPNDAVDGVDFVNSVGGNTGKPVVTNLGKGISEGENTLSKEFGVTTVSDLWDLHPFSRSGDRVIDRLQRGWNKTIGNTLNNYSKKVKRLSENLKYDNKEIEKWVAANKDDEFAMEMFDPDMFPNTGWRRKLGELLEKEAANARKDAKAPSLNFLKPLDKRVANYEIGRLINARPIMVKNEVPWTADRTMELLPEGGVDFRTTYTQGFNSNNLLPSEVDDWRKGIVKFNTDDMFNWVDLNDVVTKMRNVKAKR